MDYEEIKYLIDNFDADKEIKIQINTTGNGLTEAVIECMSGGVRIHTFSDAVADMKEELDNQMETLAYKVENIPCIPTDDKKKDRFGTYKKRKWR